MSSPNVTYTQRERLIRIETPLAQQLVLERFEGTEELSSPFEFHLTLLSDNWEIKAKDLLRKNATIIVSQADGSERFFHAVFNTFRQEGPVTEQLMVYKATVVPKLWFLQFGADCRIFQNKTVAEIVETILKDNGITDYSFKGTSKDASKYPKREYCVQYRESNLNFISRLLEEEGIFYYFDHEKTKHTVVFTDNSKTFAACPGQKTAEFTSAHGRPGKQEDGVTAFERLEQSHTGKISLTDYDFEKPNFKLAVTQKGESEPEEIYDYPGKYTETARGDHYARVRLEQRECQHLVVTGASKCRPFRPGYTFTLTRHFRNDNNKEYSLLSVSHVIVDTSYRSGGATPHSYDNTFVAILKTVPYRPPWRARKPVVQGPQTAVVVGKTGEEIWVDKYGRVKVQFYWDRVGKKDEMSSCWVRVSQSWAGKNWGWVTLPRMGQEVIVDFLEGDPDRPIITGRVYNADQMPPYTLTANQTQSGIKTRSSKQGGTENFNEIRFEDLKGSEMLTIHAEKDMDTSVENDDTQLVERNRKITVNGTHTETIKGNASIEITEGNLSLTVDTGNDTTLIKKGNQSNTLSMGNQTNTLDMGNQTVTLKMGNQTTKANLGKISMEAMQAIELKVGASSIKVDQMGVTITGMMITVDGKAITQVKGAALLMLKGGVTFIN